MTATVHASPPHSGGHDSAPAFLQGGGKMGERMRSLDWQGSPLGPPDGWPAALKTVVSLLLNSKFPMFVAWGPRLAFLYNDPYIDILGGKHPRALGRPFRDIWEEIWPDISPLIDRALAGEATFHENLPLLMRRRGVDEQTWFTFSYSPVRDETGAIPGMFCACTETTAQVLAEREHREEIERLRSLFEQAPGVMALLSGPEHVFELTNPAYLQLVGHRDILGRKVREALPEVAGQGFLQLLDHVYQSGEPYTGHAMRVQLQRTPGAELEDRFVDFVYQPVRNRLGQVVGIFAEGSDVTERIRALHELQQSDRRKDEFLAMLAHELRNPLSPISNAAQLLHMQPDAHVVRRASEIISLQVGHMTKLVDDLLDVSRVTRGLIRLEQVPVAMDAMVASAVEQVRPLLEQQRHQLTVEHAENELLVCGDRTRLVQVIANLLGNAAKFTPPGGRITVSLSADAERVRLLVADNGAGIEAEVLPHVFDLFSQGQRSPDRAQGGLGLGLALVRSLVTLHGGSVSARSDGPGQGTTVEVVLPRLREGAQPDRAQAGGGMATGRAPLRILVVDDNLDALHTLAALLESAGHEVAIAHDGVRAIELARSRRPEVLVLDIGLPDMDGYALARHLRALPELRSPLLVALTGYGQARDLERSREAGFQHHLVKPADLPRLEAILTAYATTRQGER